MIKYPLNVTIDTNIFEANKFDFSIDSTMSLLVKNVKSGKIKLILSNIVISEVEKHLSKCVDDICGKARKLRKEYMNMLPEQYLADIGMESYVQILDKDTIRQNAKEIFWKFLEDCNVERLNTDGINLEKIIEDYFSLRPPFEDGEKKRKEFPDAFIAEEIKKRFGNDEIVAIISKDIGFNKACKGSKKYLFYASLGELFDALSKNEEEYKTAVKLIRDNTDSIIQAISNLVDDSCIQVYGLSYDKDGIEYGYDYDETYLNDFYLSGMRLHIIDDIDEDIITASVWIYGNMDVDCYFKDFDNAPWDSEKKEYVFVDSKHMLEKHNIKFACRIEINSKSEEIRILPFNIILGCDSRKEVLEIDEEQQDIASDFEESDREALGFLPLSQYGDFLEENLSESPMAIKIIELFERYNKISSDYEELAVKYDEIYEQVNKNMEEGDIKKFINAISTKKNIPVNFDREATDELIKWLDCKLDYLADRMERKLPDYIEYGEIISIQGKNNSKYILSIGELYEVLEAGTNEKIEVSFSSDQKTIATGYITLTVGYLNFDEDGGATDGIEDSIEYDVDDVLAAIESLIFELEDELIAEQKIVGFLESYLKEV